MHLLIVEDDTEIAALVARALQREGYRVSFAESGMRALELIESDPPDLIVLDLMLPGMGGIEITRRVRARLDTPIVMLTAMSETEDKVAGLRAGADDYLSKPFSTAELIARIQAVTRRSAGAAQRPRSAVLQFAGWTLDPVLREVSDPGGVRILLTSAEFDLLHVLCAHAGTVLSRDRLMRLSQGRQVEPYDRSVDTLISRIRQKIGPRGSGPALIKTVRNGGYLFAADVTRAAPK